MVDPFYLHVQNGDGCRVFVTFYALERSYNDRILSNYTTNAKRKLTCT